MIDVYSFKKVAAPAVGMTRDLRVLWTLEEMNASYRVHGMDYPAGDLKSAKFRELNPFEQLPAITDDGMTLTESGAIVLYLAEKQGHLAPKDLNGHAQVMRWSFAALTTIEPQLMKLAFLKAEKDDEATAQRRAEALKTADRFLKPLDERLKTRSWVATDQFTVADILMSSVLRIAKRVNVLGDYPNLAAYRLRCEERPAWRKTAAEYEARMGLPAGSSDV